LLDKSSAESTPSIPRCFLNILPVEINAVLMIETKSQQKWIALSALEHFG
jgi:hypothetical protein